MNQPDLRIDTEALREHAQLVDHVADMFEEVAAAARHLDLHDEVYGEWPGKLIKPLLDVVQDHVLQELRNGTGATSHLADLVRSVASDVDTTDGDAAQRFWQGGP